MSMAAAADDDVKAGIGERFDRTADTYDTVIPFFGTLARDVVDDAAPKLGDAVLDLACGRGACLRVAAERVGPTGRLAGVDLSAALVDRCRDDLHELEARKPKWTCAWATRRGSTFPTGRSTRCA